MDFHEYANVFPLIEGEEFRALVADVRSQGLLEPILTYQNRILDGRNRFRACTEAGVEPEFVDFEGSDYEALSHVWSVNMARRHLNSSQRAMVAVSFGDLRDALRAAAKKRQGAVPQLIAEVTDANGETDAVVADMFGTNRQYVKDARKIAEQAPNKAEAIRRGEVTITQAKREIVREAVSRKLEQVAARHAAEPTGVYDCIVIDPPWPMEKIDRDVRPNQAAFDYPTMTEDELRELAIPAADNCHLWLWTTQRFLPMAFRLLPVWGFKYVCTFVWHKPGGFQPVGLPQYNCEFALYARMGTPFFADTKSFNTAFDAPRGTHSEKPQDFYDVVARVTGGRRLDMFNRRAIPGFDGWGKEAQ